MSRDTVDYSYGRPNLTALKQAGITKVMRYLSPNGTPKNIVRSELESLHAAGFSVGFVYEWYAARAKEGREAGIYDGHIALQQANELGIPMDVPIFAAIDFDASVADQPLINAYIDGFASVLGPRGKSAYGGYWVIKRLFEQGHITNGWQTYAWSGGNWYPQARLRQVKNGQTIGGAAVDLSESFGDVFWEPKNKQTSAPVPQLPKSIGATHGYAMQRGDTFWGLETANKWTHGTLSLLNKQWIGREGQIPVGTIIQIPGAAPAKKQAPAPKYTPLGKHRIVAGDTFTGLDIANKWPVGTTQGLNPWVNPRTLQIGSYINVPATRVTPKPAVKQTRKIWIIRSGDTFWSLETKNHWPYGTLQHLNPDVDPTKLRIGSRITIPA